jgi:hypothetical protein
MVKQSVSTLRIQRVLDRDGTTLVDVDEWPRGPRRGDAIDEADTDYLDVLIRLPDDELIPGTIATVQALPPGSGHNLAPPNLAGGWDADALRGSPRPAYLLPPPSHCASLPDAMTLEASDCQEQPRVAFFRELLAWSRSPWHGGHSGVATSAIAVQLWTPFGRTLLSGAPRLGRTGRQQEVTSTSAERHSDTLRPGSELRCDLGPPGLGAHRNQGRRRGQGGG